MRALVLAAGRGSRLEQLGADRPKCLVELGGRALFERQVAALRRGGATEIGVVRGYRAQMLEFPGIRTFTNARWAETNMVASLAVAEEWLSAGPVLVSYGDIFYGAALVSRLREAPGELLVAYDPAWRTLWERRFADPLADAETFRVDAHGRLLEIGGKTTHIEDIQGQYMGLLKFTAPAWSAVQRLRGQLDAAARDRLDMTSMLRRLLAAGGVRIGTVRNEAAWGEVDSAADVALYERLLAAGDLTLEEAQPLPRAGQR